MQKKKLLGISILMFLSACSSSKALTDTQKSENVTTNVSTIKTNPSKSSFDTNRTIRTSVKNMMSSGVLNKSSSQKYTLAVTHVVNMTRQNFDTKDIQKNLEIALATTKKVRVLTKGSSLAPQMNVSARITERTAYVRSGKKRQEYYLNIALSDPKAGLTLWSNITPIIKR